MSAAEPATGAPCLPCEMERCPERAIVFRDPLWACEVVPGFDVPGWFVLRVRRHALRILSLNAAELASYGRRVHGLDREAALELRPSVAAAYARRAASPAEIDA